MNLTCPHCKTSIDEPTKFCESCGEKLPIKAVFTDLRLRLKTGQELRIGESSVFECEVFNESCLFVSNVELSLSSSRFAENSRCFIGDLEPESSETLNIEVDIDKAGRANLGVTVKGLVENNTPVCYEGRTQINTFQKEDIRTDSDVNKINIVVGPDAIFDKIVINPEHGQKESPAEPVSEWLDILLKRNRTVENEWFEKIRDKWLLKCPYCAATIDMNADACEICEAPLPSWFSKRREFLGEHDDNLPPVSSLEIAVPSLGNKVFRFHTTSRITWGKRSDRDISTLFYDEEGRCDDQKSNAISRDAGQITIEDDRAMLLNGNKFNTRFETRDKSKSIELMRDEKIELEQDGTLSLTNLCFLEIGLFTTWRHQETRESSSGGRERGEQRSQMSAQSSARDSDSRSSCFIWPDKIVESVRICRTDSASNEEHILLESSATIGSSDECCVRIPKSGVKKNHARIIFYDRSIWFENRSKIPLRFESDTETKHLERDAIMKIDENCIVKFGYLETHLKINRQTRGG